MASGFTTERRYLAKRPIIIAVLCPYLLAGYATPMARNPVKYAEEHLDVHGPWKEAQFRLHEHFEASARVTATKSLIREHKRSIEDLKHEITALAPSLEGWPDKIMAQKDFIKLQIAESAEIQKHESTLASYQSEMEDAIAEARHHELGIGVLSARLVELGGLLHFYAESKHAETARHMSNTSASPHVNTNQGDHVE